VTAAWRSSGNVLFDRVFEDIALPDFEVWSSKVFLVAVATENWDASTRQSPRETLAILPTFGFHSLNGKIGWGFQTVTSSRSR
jgi:hypothetical protein